MTAITIADVTQTTLDGTGVFDTLMRANKAHLEAEFAKNRIKGPEYATVYLGSLEAVLRASMEFLLAQQRVDLEAQLLTHQVANAIIEGTVLTAQKCKLDAEFELLQNQKLKTAAETTLLNQKVITEQAQTTTVGVDENSVIGKQKALYTAQTNGFTRDAEQKAATIMVDSWKIRRTTDEGVPADNVNNLRDEAIGNAVTKLLSGIGTTP